MRTFQLPREISLTSCVGLAFCALSAILSGCVHLSPATGLDHALPASHTIARKAWLASAEITDQSVGEKKVFVESALTTSLLHYIRDGGYFKEVDVLPGKIKETDVILEFRFDRFQQLRKPHPSYFPLAILTLTFYIWAGGPIYVDSSDLSGSLTVKQPGKPNTIQVRSELREAHGVSIWSPQYALPSGLEARTSFVRDLLAKAVSEIGARQTGGNTHAK